MGILRTIKGNCCKIGLWAAAALLIVGVAMGCVYASEPSANVAVSFVNYDMGTLPGAYPSGSVPDGAMLYTAADLEAVDGFQPSAGCTWYLYKEAADGEDAFGPAAIPDPPSRVGYEFYDWASLNTTNADGLHTVGGDTVFLARYARSGQYLVNFYYQYNDDTRSVAAPTTSTVGGLGDSVSMELPQLETLNGLTPQIHCLYEEETAPGVAEAKAAAEQLNTMLQNGTFSATLDESFLELCRTAWFVEWDTTTNNYQTDENGVVRINIPVVYAFDGTASFQVHYYLQGADDPRSYEPVEADFETAQISGSTHVSLEELGLVKEYEGFTLNAISRQYAAGYTVSPNGSTVIDLHYDREMYYVAYALHGGNLREPVAYRYGQTLPTGKAADNRLLATPVRAGYTFTGWTYRSSDGTELSALPATMPAYDLVLEANWEPAATTVTIAYWMENANDKDYTPVASREINVTTESVLSYEDIATFLEPDADGMQAAGISDGAYFSLVTDGDKAISPVTAAGDGSTTINAYYDRKEYTLVFHIGKVVGNSYQISTSGNSSSKAGPTDWTSGYSGWKSGADAVELTMNGHAYQISNDTELCYQITAKYGAFIGDEWPAANENTVPKTVSSGGITYQLFTWGTHAASPYFKNKTNKNIMGVYSTMSAELIIQADRPDIPHHLTAYWAKISGKGANGSNNGEYKIHHYLLEAVPGAVDANTPLVSFDDYQNYTRISVSQNTNPATAGITSIGFYEYEELQVRTTHTSAGQNPPAFANLTFQYGCYNGADVYFFYTYDNYTLTYYENNPDLTGGRPAASQNIPFHYVGGKPLKDTLAVSDFVHDYEPENPYTCQYGNQHLFAGWYRDPACTIPIDWDTIASESSMTAYAKWDSPTFDLTLETPGGSLSEDILQSIRDKGYAVEVTADSGGCSYRIHDVTDGTPINQVLGRSQHPVNRYGLEFQDWYETDADGLANRFLFDDSQVMNGHRTLTAHWVEQDTGVYVVRALTTQNPYNGLEPVEVDGVVYYRLRQDETVSGLVAGSTVTLEPRLISAYLPTHGSLTRIITGSADDPTIFDFVYTPMGNQTVTYTVHYVLDIGENYGRTASANSIALSNSVTFTLSAGRARSTSSITGAIRAIAAPIPGYVPRNGYQSGMVLSSSADENHLYFYYVANADAGADLGLVGGEEPYGVSCRVDYYIWDAATGEYTLQDTTTMESAVGTILYAAPYARQYLSQSDTPDLALDQTHTSSSVVVSEHGNNTLPLYFKPSSDGESPPDTDWNHPAEDLPEPQPNYVPTLPPAPVPDTDGTGDGESGSGESGGGESGGNESGSGETGGGESGGGETGGGESGGGETGGGESGGGESGGGESGGGETGGGESGGGESGGGESGGGETGGGESGGGETGGSESGSGESGSGETGGSETSSDNTPPIYYTLHYASNGGTVYPAEQYTANTVVPLDKTPLRAGCHFTGWYADAALTRPITSVTMTGNYTVYAGWESSTVPELLNGTDHFAYIIGYADGTVRPLAQITRAEVAAIFFRLLDPDIRTAALTNQNPFADVDDSAWYNQAVSTLHALGIFQGRTETLFDADAPITRAEFAAVCARFDRSDTTATNSFTDLANHWAREEIGCAASLGWILGYADGTFRPDQPITRAEAMSMVNRVLHRLPETSDDLLPDMAVWPDNRPEDWYYLTVQEATNTHAYIQKGDLYETWTQRLDDPDWSQYQ
ncbi:InlB B-repeat-containing protein [Candidatus Avoscillospira sp. LCP25S3_F1]|uniref:InlB B-repeat-containing protein n=1 Tax=Candidatus Avoscillospira sp. LCP25S3_F1 TaxID=3438825 RepID=UPI003F933819